MLIEFKARQFELKQSFPPYKYAILDLEGDPPKFFGNFFSYILVSRKLQTCQELFMLVSDRPYQYLDP